MKTKEELTDEELEHISGGQRLFINSSPLALNVLNQANKQAQAIAKSSEKISTSQKINLGQDDPISNAIRKHLEELSQRQKEE